MIIVIKINNKFCFKFLETFGYRVLVELVF